MKTNDRLLLTSEEIYLQDSKIEFKRTNSYKL